MEGVSNIEVQQTDCLTQIFEWGHNHTNEIQIARFIIDGIGITFLLVGLTTTVTNYTAVLLTGVAIIVAVEITMIALEVIGLIAIDPRQHVYEPSKINDSIFYYEGDLPVLKIRAETHYQAGFDHGYLAAHQITQVISRMNMLYSLGYLGAKSELYAKLDEIKRNIPTDYLEEMEGMVEGLNLRMEEDSWFTPHKYTIEDAMTLHMLPDLMHLALAPSCLFGCTVFAAKDEKSGEMCIGRNLDWPGLGVGRLTLLQDIQVAGKKQLLFVTIPGCCGAITGLGDLFVSINVTEPKGPIYDIQKGIPSLFLNRKVLEECGSVKEAKTYIEQDDTEHTAAVPYHMFVSDKHDAFFAHFGQGENGETHMRSFNPDSADPFFTLNCSHTSAEPPTEPNTLYYGTARFNNIHSIWKSSRHLPLAERMKLVMRAPGVNNPMSVHSILWMGDHLVISFDNSFAASGQKCVVFLDQQFEK